jgi:hypothetical protein
MIRAVDIFGLLTVLLSLLAADLHGADRSSRTSFILRGTYTSSSKLFPTPEAVDEAARNRSLEFDDAFGFGFEVRRQLGNENVEIGLGAEFLSTSKSGLATIPGGPSRIQLPVTDGFRFIPVELSGYFVIPFSSESVKFFMGGGVGFYYGDRIYHVVNRVAQTVENQVAIGIHVLTGVDYFLTQGISVRGELKFRDPQFNITSKFADADVQYGGQTFRLSQQPFTSRVNLDGLVVTVGMALNF